MVRQAEGLLVELNRSSCYEFVEQFCVFVFGHISAMDKQRECPEECREAVSSLMYGASRFADLPELRDLRSTFSNRYAGALESYVNKEFVEKLKSTPPTKDRKLQLLQEIASEYDIEWNSKALEQKLYNPPAINQERANNANAEYMNLRTMDESIRNDDGSWKKSTASKKEGDNSFSIKEEVKKDTSNLHKRSPAMPERDDQDRIQSSYGRQDRQKGSNSTRISKEEFDDEKSSNYRLLSPPYVKQKEVKNETRLGVSTTLPCGEGKGATKYDVQGTEEQHQRKVDASGESKPKPRSVRRRPSKPPQDHENIGSAEVNARGKMNSTEARQDVGKEGVQVLGEHSHHRNDLEEKTIDKLLLHYSKNKSPYEAQQTAYTAAKHGGRDAPPTRAASLPVEQPSQPETLIRASSYQPDKSEGHVHPKLPDYDDFVARLASLRGK